MANDSRIDVVHKPIVDGEDMINMVIITTQMKIFYSVSMVSY